MMNCTICKGHTENEDIVCEDCKNAQNDKGEVSHPSLARCPRCEALTDPGEETYYDGCGIDVQCGACDLTFHVQIQVEVSIGSPAVGDMEDTDNDEDDEPSL